MKENREAEIAVLGSMLIDPECIDRMRSRLTPDEFYRPDARMVFEALCAVADRGAVDILLLKHELRNRGKLEEVGGELGLLEAMENTPTAANADYYAGIVHKCYLQRAMAEHANAVRQIAGDPDLDPAAKAAAIQADFAERVGDEVRMSAQSGGPGAAVLDLVRATVEGRRRRVGTPWPKVDALTMALQPETVTLLCGSPGASKSLMLLQAAAHWHEEGIPFAINELEQSREYHLMRALAQRCAAPGMTDPAWIEANKNDALCFTETEQGWLDAFGACFTATDTQPTLRQIAHWIRDKARAGAKVIAVDPITAAAHTRRDTWGEDNEFLQHVKQAATEYGAAVVLVTHPTKQFAGPDLNLLAGSAAYARFAQTAVWLETHDDKTNTVRTDCGRAEIEHNRTLHILKARNGKGQGLRLAFGFNAANLTLHEAGIITKSQT